MPGIYPVKRPWTTKPPPGTPIDHSNPLSKGIMCAYLFDNPRRLHDSSGRNHHGTAVGTPTVVSSLVGPVVRFNGVTEGFSVPNHADLNFNGEDFTTVLGVIPYDDGTGGEYFEHQNGSNGIWQMRDLAGPDFAFFINETSPNNFNAQSSAYTTGQHYNVVGVNEDFNTDIVLFVDAVPQQRVNTDNVSIDTTVDAPLLFAHGNAGFNQCDLNYFFLFRDFKTTDEIEALNRNPYQIFKPRTLWLPFEELTAAETAFYPLRRPWRHQPPERVNGFDRQNAFGARCVWSLIPGWGNFKDDAGSVKSVGQVMQFDAASHGAALGSMSLEVGSYGRGIGSVKAYRNTTGSATVYDNLENLEDTLGIIFPDNRNLTLLSIARLAVDGIPGGGGDPRFFSKDAGTSEAQHDLMVGMTGANEARTRIRINGGTRTILTSGSAMVDDAVQLVAGTVQPANATQITVRVHHLTIDGIYSTQESSAITGAYSPRTTTDMALGSTAGDIDNAFEGDIIGVWAFDRAFTEADCRAFMENPWQVFRPRTIMMPLGAAADAGGGDQGIAVGQAIETDTAQPLTGAFTVPVGLATETNLAQPLQANLTVSLGLASETDTAQPIQINLTVALGQALETDLAQPLTGAFTVPVGLATETDTAQPITVRQGLVISIGQAIETDIAQPLTGAFTVPMGLASETDIAQPIQVNLTVPVGLATETDTAQPIALRQGTVVSIGQAIETDTAQPLTGAFTVPVGLAIETDIAQPITLATLTKTATVPNIVGGQNLSNLSYVVFDGYDISVAPILQQGFGESTDGSGNLEIDLGATAVVNGDPLSIIITDYTVSPGPSNKAAVCHTTAVVV